MAVVTRSHSLHAGSAWTSHRSNSLHGGCAFAPVKPLPRRSVTVHGGTAFLAMKAMPIPMRPSVSLEMLSDDILSVIFAPLLTPVIDVTTLIMLSSVCKQLSRLAQDALASTSLEDRVTALVQGRVPPALVSTLERQCAKLAMKGMLSESSCRELFAYANLYVDDRMNPAQKWLLSPMTDGKVECDDCFYLRGFDAVPMSEATCRTLQAGTPSGTRLVTEWYATHMPERSLHHLHLPCLLAGPPLRLARAGSRRDAASVRRVPIEMCRVAKPPNPDDLHLSKSTATISDNGVSWQPFAPVEGTARGITLVSVLLGRDI